MAEQKTNWIKTIYLYLVSFVALFMIVFSTADMVNIALRTWVFPKADNFNYGYYPEPECTTPSDTTTTTTATATDPSRVKPFCISKEERERIDAEQRSSQRQRDLVRDFSFLIVGVPLFSYHWLIIRRKEI